MTKEELQKQVNRLLKEIVELNELNDKQEDKIKELKQQLKDSNPKIQNAYLTDIYNIFALDGDLYLQSEHLRLIINCESFLGDLDLINHLVLKENKKTQQMYLDNLKETINKYA
jgi:chromosome segregation ATPase